MTQLPAGIPDRHNFRVRRRVIGRRHLIASPANHLSIPDDHTSKWPTPALLDSMAGQPDRLPQKFLIRFRDHRTNLLSPPLIDENFGHLRKIIHRFPHLTSQKPPIYGQTADGPWFACTLWLLIGYWILATAWISIWASFFLLYLGF
jgi:hypothetical protein